MPRSWHFAALFIAVTAMPARSADCDSRAIEKVAALIVELPAAVPERQRSIGAEIGQLLASSVDLVPSSNPDAYREAVAPCYARALERAQALVGGTPVPAPAPADPAADMAKKSATLARLRQVSVALHAHAAETNAIPSTEEGLKALVEQGIVRRQDILDGWGRVFIYRRETLDLMAFELSSAGPDGVPHTEDDVTQGVP